MNNIKNNKTNNYTSEIEKLVQDLKRAVKKSKLLLNFVILMRNSENITRQTKDTYEEITIFIKYSSLDKKTKEIVDQLLNQDVDSFFLDIDENIVRKYRLKIIQ